MRMVQLARDSVIRRVCTDCLSIVRSEDIDEMGRLSSCHDCGSSDSDVVAMPKSALYVWEERRGTR